MNVQFSCANCEQPINSKYQGSRESVVCSKCGAVQVVPESAVRLALARPLPQGKEEPKSSDQQPSGHFHPKRTSKVEANSSSKINPAISLGIVNSRFPVLSFFSIVLRILGWLVLLGGLISSLLQGIALAQCLPDCFVNMPWLLQNIGLVMTGVGIIVMGELIGVAFSIENNTRKMVELVEYKWTSFK